LNDCWAPAQSNRISLALGDQEGKYQHFAMGSCSSFWFYHFVEGARNQMGQDWHPNKAIPVELLLLLLELIELKIQEAVSGQGKNFWIVFHTYVVVCYTLSLRGCEGFLLDLSGLTRKLNAAKGWFLTSVKDF
jgi:hypothetical protein